VIIPLNSPSGSTLHWGAGELCLIYHLLLRLCMQPTKPHIRWHFSSRSRAIVSYSHLNSSVYSVWQTKLLPVSFLLHVKYALSYRIVSYSVLARVQASRKKLIGIYLESRRCRRHIVASTSAFKNVVEAIRAICSCRFWIKTSFPRGFFEVGCFQSWAMWMSG